VSLPVAPPIRVTPVPEALLHPPLQPWSRVWRYLIAVLSGLIAWAVTGIEQLANFFGGALADATDLLQVLEREPTEVVRLGRNGLRGIFVRAYAK